MSLDDTLRLAQLLNAYAADVVRIDAQLGERDARMASLEADNTILREIVSALLTGCHRLIDVVRYQKRALNTYTREREITYAEEIRAIDQMVTARLSAVDPPVEHHL